MAMRRLGGTSTEGEILDRETFTLVAWCDLPVLEGINRARERGNARHHVTLRGEELAAVMKWAGEHLAGFMSA